MSSLFSDQPLLADSSGRSTLWSELSSSVRCVVLYFSAHWCPPCRQFTPMLKAAWEQAQRRLKHPGSVQIVFVSSDRSLQEQLSYMRNAHGNWPAVPQGSPLARYLGTTFSVRGIPALIAVNAADGAVISSSGRQEVMSQGAEAFLRWESLSTGPEAAALDTSIVETIRDNPSEVAKDAAEILIKLLANVLREPNNIKYRSVKLSNPKIENKLLPANGAFEVLFSVGFEEADDSLFLPLNASMDVIKAFQKALTKLLDELQNGRARPVPQPPRSTPQPGVKKQEARPSEANSKVPSCSSGKQEQKNAGFTIMTDIERHVQLARALESKSAQQAARRVVPLDDLKASARVKYDALKAEDTAAKESTIDDLLLLELLDWFKEQFFAWVDVPGCDKCGSRANVHFKSVVPPTPEEQKFRAATVEGYQCSACSDFLRFPRYNDAAKLLETRRGRCGEWANCFALVLRACEFDVRLVYDLMDHVWVEVYSQNQGRWLHADPCENLCDKPLVYELGWRKKPVFVLATSAFEVQDVAWRYSANHEELDARRKASGVNLGLLRKELLARSEQMQSKLSPDETRTLLDRRLRELIQLMVENKGDSEEESQGRKSGSKLWRLARGEIATDDVKADQGYIWKVSRSEAENGAFVLTYNVVSDVYTRGDRGRQSQMKGWAKGVSEADGIFRKEEKDWEQCYLARKEGCTNGSVSWEIDLSDVQAEVQEILLDVNNKTYEDGRVIWQVCGGNNCLLPRSGVRLESKGLAGSKKVKVTALLSGGKGDVAWQHAQLFRTPKNVSEAEACSKFFIKLLLKRLNDGGN